MRAFTARYVEPRRARQAVRSFVVALGAWCGEKVGIDPVYLGVLLVASLELGIQRILGR